MEKVCSKRASKNVWSKDELIQKALVKFPEHPRAFWTRMTKEEICNFLKIPFHVKPPSVIIKQNVVISQQKSCTSRKSKTYPNRYTREELIQFIRSKPNNVYSYGDLKKYSLKGLCRIARLPFIQIKSAPKQQTGTTPALGPLASLEQKEGRHEQKKVHAVQTNPSHLLYCVLRSNLPLKPHQIKIVDYLRHHRGIIAVHALGSGKTLTAVAASQCYLDQHPRNKVLFIGPASLLANFKKEMERYGGLRHEKRYVLQSYEKFLTDNIKGRIKSSDCNRTMLIIDEGHNLRTVVKKVIKRSSGATEEKGKKTKRVADCADFADRVLILTATPLVNSPLDIIPLLHMIRDNPSPVNSLLTINDKGKAQQFFDEPQNFEKYVRNRIHFFRPEDDPKRQYYPAVREHDIYLKMNPKYLERYLRVEDNLLDEEQGGSNALKHIFGSDAKLKPFFNGIRRGINTLDKSAEESEHSPKIRWIHTFLKEKSKEASNDGTGLPKTLIFSQFLDMGSRAILQRIPPEWRSVSAIIDGSVPKPKRAAIVEAFNNGEKRLLFISKAGGEGLDLKETKNVIVMESGWNEASTRQAIGRAVRFMSHTGLPYSERLVDVYKLFLIKGHDEKYINQILTMRSIFSPHDGRPVSADMILRIFQLLKEDDIGPFTVKLKNYALK